MEDEKLTVSYKDLRETFYRLRDFEISNLWQRSIFLSALLVLLFPTYGFLTLKLLETTERHLLYNEICCALALCAISFSIIWVMMAKGSKAWFEVYERKIVDIEKDLKIEEKYRMGKELHPWDLDAKLTTTKAGRYSVSRLNILIGIFLMILWVIIFTIHYIVAWFTFGDSNLHCILHAMILTLLPVFLIIIIWTAGGNMWAKSGSLQKE